MSRADTSGSRRMPLPPSPLDDELVRTHLLEVLAGRFDVPITALVAGAGFGKTTALAQAMRANDAAARGIDVWVACEPGDEDAARLSAAILAGLDVVAPGGRAVDRVLGALRAAAPLDVCLVIDDLHELPAMSAGEQLVCELTSRLPPHAHLVLASRDPLPIPLARRRAAGQVVEVDAEALAFTDAEVEALAGILGEDEAVCRGLAGWPSLVRLVLSAPPGATRQFLWEEIVAGLSPAERSGLLALAVLGSGSAGEVARVARGEADIDELVGAIPLLHRDAEGNLGAHQLWEDATARLFPAAEVLEARRRALQVLLERGETIRLGSAAVRWEDSDMFRLACVALVRESLGVLPTDTAARWLAATPARAVGTPEHQLLDLALRHAQHRHHDDMDAELDALEVGFVELGDDDARSVTLALGAVAAHARGDTARLLVLTERIGQLPGATRGPLLRFFVGAVEAAGASLAGDVEGALGTIEAISFDQVPPPVRELVTRLHATMLMLAGRADEAVAIAGPLLESPHAFVRTVPSMLGWAAGDPSGYLAARPSTEPLPDDHLYRFIRTAHGAVVAASLGDRALAATVRPEIEASIATPLNVRDSAIASVALTCCQLLEHEDGPSSSPISRHLALHPLTDARSDAHLRRNLAIVYLAEAEVRQHWDAAELGPVHRRARARARDLLAAREGRLDPRAELGPPATVVTSLPLAWSVELAVRAVAAGCPDGARLLGALTTWLPAPTRSELEWLVGHGDPTCQTAAGRLVEELGARTDEPLSIDVLGPLRLRVGADEVTNPELRRSRVRTVLALLVLRGPMRRERICDLLWPDLEPAAAAQNLRVTLSRLRRVVEPDRAAGQSTSRIRTHGDSIELAGPPVVDTDLARFNRDLAAADQARSIGDSTEELDCLTRAVELWRGEPLADLAALDELQGEIEFIHRSLVDECLRLGELLLVAGRFDEALHLAEQSRLASPYSERAHRLAIAGQLQRQDRVGLAAAVRSTETMLADLGVEPEASTQMLLRRAAARLGPSTDPDPARYWPSSSRS